jgi:hypothetical protein
MREMDSEKIETVLKNFPNVPEKQIKKLYYSLEDFWRISISGSDITKILKAIHKLLSKHQDSEILYKDLNMENGTTIIFISPKEKILSGKILKLCSNFKITLSRIEMSETNILIALISREDKPIGTSEVEAIVSKVIC